MDGRWKFAVAGGILLAGLVGCTSTKPPSSPPPPSSTPGKNSIYVPEPTDESTKAEGPLASSTMLTFASAWVDAVSKDPNRPAADREHTLSKAKQVYQEVLTREPKNVDALLGLGELYQVTGEVEHMKKIEAKVTNLHAGNAKVWAWVAVRRAQCKEFDAAALAYHKAVQLDPENRLYRIHLGFTLARGGRYAEGYEWLNRSMRESEAHYNLAMMMLHNGATDQAKVELEKSLKADPNFQAAGTQLAALSNQPPVPGGSDVRTVGHQESDGPARNR